MYPYCKVLPSHCTQAILNDFWEYKKNNGNSFEWKYKQWLKERVVRKLENVVICPNMPLKGVSIWNIPEPNVEMRLLGDREKAEGRYTNGYEINGFMRKKFYSCLQLYTDGSKDPIEQKVGVGVYIPKFETKISLRLSDKTSVNSSALIAIIVGLQWLEQTKPNRMATVICSDSASALKSILSTKTDREDLIVEMYTLLYRLNIEGIIVYFCWVYWHSRKQIRIRSIKERHGRY